MDEAKKRQREHDRAERVRTRQAMDDLVQIRALEKVRDNSASTSSEVLDAVRLIEQIKKK